MIFFANYSEATIYEADNYHHIEMIIPKSNDYSENETKLHIDNIKTTLAAENNTFMYKQYERIKLVNPGFF